MANRRTSIARGDSEGMCEKVYNAICCLPADRPHPTKSAFERQHSGLGWAIAIEGGDGGQNSSPLSGKCKSKAASITHHDESKCEVKEENDKYTNYIEQVKSKMRTSATTKRGNSIRIASTSGERRDSFNDRVSVYLNRAKMKMRRTSSIERHGGKSEE